MKIEKNFDLTNYNSYRISAFCNRAIFCESESDVIEYFRENIDTPKILIGSGHNIILQHEYYSEDFVIFNGNYANVELINNSEIVAEAGVSMLDLSIFAQRNNLSGIEIFYDIPSSLGGAIVMNAGASGEEIKDVLRKVRYFDLEDMQVKEIEVNDIDFAYRNSFFQRARNKVILKAWLSLLPKDPDEIMSKMSIIKEQRWAKQPKDLPNAGSVFKRPPGFYVGAMIDELNLKGFTIGGAQISQKHGGFIVNYNRAKGSDIVAIINEVKRQVFEKFGVDLEIEQRII